MTTVIAAIAAYSRLFAQPVSSQHSTADALLDRGMVVTQLLMGIGTSSVIMTLVLMMHRTHLYYKYRTQLTVLNRLLRVLLQLTAARTPTTIGFMALGVTSRSLSEESAGKALAVLIFHPLAYNMQQALLVLPVKVAVVLQILNTLTTLWWSRVLPCILKHSAAAGSSNTAAAASLYAAAERVCTSAQSYAAWAYMTATGQDGVYPSWRGSVCHGVTAVQTLHVFFTLCCMLLLPVAAVASLDAWLTTHAQMAGTDTANSNSSTSSRSRSISTTSTASTIDSSSTSSSHAGASSSSSTLPHTSPAAYGAGASSSSLLAHSAQQPANQISQERVSLDARVAAIAAVSQPLHAYYLVLLVPVVLAAFWLVAELLTGWFSTTIDCATVLRVCGIVARR